LGVLLFALAFFPAGRLIAGITATISGTVTDPTGAIVAGATVTATNVDTGVALSQTTNSQGFYSFPELPVGKYTIDVKMSGFKAYQQTGVGPRR
jgi:Carboxypeptidase regulatory-like domain